MNLILLNHFLDINRDIEADRGPARELYELCVI
jgi:hypothetical protein